MHRPTLRFLATLPLAAALVLSPTMSTSAFAAGKSTGTAASANGKAKAAASKAKGSAKAPAGNTKRKPDPVRFTVVGKLGTVDATANTATVAVTSGMKDLKRKTVVLTVTGTAKIVLNDVVVPLASLPAGARVTAVGTRSGDALTASKLIATTS